MKKIYSKPLTEVIRIQAPQVLTASGGDMPPVNWGSGFGQVPGIGQSEDNLLA